MWKTVRDALILIAALGWGTYEILHQGRPPILILVGSMLGYPLAKKADEIIEKFGPKHNDSDTDK